MDDRTRLSLELTLLVLLLGLWSLEVVAADCSFCQGGLGNVGEPVIGTVQNKDAPTSNKGSNGHYRQDSLGPVNTHEGVTWRKDGLGNIKGSDGSLYRPNALGQFDRNGKTSLPPHQQSKWASLDPRSLRVKPTRPRVFLLAAARS